MFRTINRLISLQRVYRDEIYRVIFMKPLMQRGRRNIGIFRRSKVFILFIVRILILILILITYHV